MKHDEKSEVTLEPGGACCSASTRGSGVGTSNAMSQCQVMAGRMAKGMLSGLLVVLVAATTLWVGFSHLQARSFERMTGTHVTTWDAMFLDLTVERAVE